MKYAMTEPEKGYLLIEVKAWAVLIASSKLIRCKNLFQNKSFFLLSSSTSFYV